MYVQQAYHNIIILLRNLIEIHKVKGMEKLLLICISLVVCVVSQPQDFLRDMCKWSTCRPDVSECPEEYPDRLESSACLRPDGLGCSGVSSLCCKLGRSIYEPYWVGGPPNCFANCSDCAYLCYGFTRKCNENGDMCVFGAQILCGGYMRTSGGSLKLDRDIISVINFVSNNVTPDAQ